MLNRNLKAKVAKATFFDDYNEVDIFIEDTAQGYKKLFKKIIQRILGGEFKVDNVFPLGGRKEVLTACRSDQKSRNRARLYIIDGDLYILSGEVEDTKIKGLYVLPRYCIENHLICKISLLSILEEEDPNNSLEVLESMFDYDSWVNAVKTNLVDLFVEYGVAKRIAPTLQTVAFGYSGLVSTNTGEVDPEKVKRRICDVQKETINIAGKELYDKTKAEIAALVDHNEESLLSIVSGKDILMPLIMMRCKRLVNFKAPNLSVKLRIANICDLNSMKNLPDFIYRE
ncbi:TPA: DUF4435 domain-containing protein [Vibrio vulnificus]|nr:DUF4435 domain-containing protein [Vibrio vulnificus]ELG5190194.1 DUF4435 domain-containing protein [Vibrio vulnificus]MCU8165080.1 DUF4435 domain-containing protein [Vibrio vulnificus]MCU8169793.1 DUF4435 domain-containing protein [Vibrio vulnificus]HAS8597474.1 DUF4435 domain-containing protein [Vibrio vulnificus]